MELAPGRGYLFFGPISSVGFNPCFCGTRARTLCGINFICWRDKVSILVFVELAPGLGRDLRAVGGLRVSILVFVELAPGRSRWLCAGSPRPVSILVFVELAPGLPAMTCILGKLSCFNPCFCGTRARTPCDDVHPGQIELFQSLFLWNSRPDFARTRCLHDPEIVSILVFVELAPGQRWCGGYSFKPLVSILVFVELAPGPFAIYLQLSILSVFQSLFLWNSRPDFHLYILP